ncbi:GH25 family lysozyme [Sphingomonas sp. S2-65]|uniref:GH25 family lysozyme n=1 Tax=Sphingomonas sp. S2-65 TaxID=2903960 RepID=UPI001F26811A|nr:GH25 family lysozyme [Sphingomonas sp. S2-65]UYY59439.1 GH25 family lysozyme [Sphingomonas sp. S2-65]
MLVSGSTRRLRFVALLLLASILIGGTGWSFFGRWRPSITDYPVQGVDVSEGDGAIDWWQARTSGVQFVYARATIGAHGRDSRFAEHWRTAAEAGLQRGALHLYAICQPGLAQAGNFVSTVARTDDQLSPAILLDLSGDCPRPSRSAMLMELARFIAAVETHSGKRVILGITKRFEGAYQLSTLTTAPLWARGVFFAPGYLARPWTMWQASHLRRIQGAAGPVNWDVMAR